MAEWLTNWLTAPEILSFPFWGRQICINWYPPAVCEMQMHTPRAVCRKIVGSMRTQVGSGQSPSCLWLPFWPHGTVQLPQLQVVVNQIENIELNDGNKYICICPLILNWIEWMLQKIENLALTLIYRAAAGGWVDPAATPGGSVGTGAVAGASSRSATPPRAPQFRCPRWSSAAVAGWDRDGDCSPGCCWCCILLAMFLLALHLPCCCCCRRWAVCGVCVCRLLVNRERP